MRNKGFTLIEVVISVIIVAVIAGIATTAYTMQKRRSEFNGMRAVVRSLVTAAKDQYYATSGTVPLTSTASTLATNTRYQLALRDANFYNYRTVVPSATVGQPFDVIVQYAPRGSLGDYTNPSTYTYNNNGTQVSCVGPDCMT